jgi:hypothetical protein
MAVTVLILLTSGLALTGCGSSSPEGSQEFNTPLHSVYSWFSAINHKDELSMVAHAAPVLKNDMNWNDGDTSVWPTFANVSCHLAHSRPSSANILCTFKESAPPGNQIETFWSVALARSSTGKWLITNYGQG